MDWGFFNGLGHEWIGAFNGLGLLLWGMIDLMDLMDFLLLEMLVFLSIYLVILYGNDIFLIMVIIVITSQFKRLSELYASNQNHETAVKTSVLEIKNLNYVNMELQYKLTRALDQLSSKEILMKLVIERNDQKVSQLNLKLDEVKKHFSKVNVSHRDLTTKLSTHQREIQNLSEEKTKYSQVANSLDNILDTRDREIENLKWKIKKLSEENMKLDLIIACENNNTQVAMDLGNTLETREREIENLKWKMKNLSEENSKVQNDLENASRSYDEQILCTTNKLCKIKDTEINHLHELKKSLEQKNINLTNDAIKHKNRYDKKVAIISTLQKQVQNLTTLNQKVLTAKEKTYESNIQLNIRIKQLETHISKNLSHEMECGICAEQVS